MGSAYSQLALLYDDLMADVDYAAWADYIRDIIESYGAPGRRLLDLGCGTGSLTIKLHQLGFDIIGADLSADMLSVAAEKGLACGLGIERWKAMDMRTLRFAPASFDIVLCACDGLNYLANDTELDTVLRSVKDILRPGGLLLFDVHSAYKMRHIFPSGPFVQECEAGYCIWSSQFDEQGGNATHTIILFVRQEDELFRRHEELHTQHYFAPSVIQQALAANGLELLLQAPWAQLTSSPATAPTERWQFVARS